MSMLFGFGTPPRIERPDRERMRELARAYIAAVDTYDACAESRTAENWEAYLVANDAWRAVLAQQRKWEDQQDTRTLAAMALADAEEVARG